MGRECRGQRSADASPNTRSWSCAHWRPCSRRHCRLGGDFFALTKSRCQPFGRDKHNLWKILFSPQSRRWSPARHLAHCAHSRTGASTDKILMKAWIKTKVDYVSKHTDGVPLFSLRRPPLSVFHFLSDSEPNTLLMCVSNPGHLTGSDDKIRIHL